MTMLRLPILDPDLGYIGGKLLLPKSKVAVAPIEAALTFFIQAKNLEVKLFTHHQHHIEVPRNFLSREQLRKMDIELVDLRPRSFEPGAIRLREGFSLLDHQIDPWALMAPAFDSLEDMTLRLGTGRGKTVMGLVAGAYCNGPIMVVSAQEAHLRNWEIELKGIFEFQGTIGWIGGKEGRFDWKADVVFCTIQTLVKRWEAGDLPPEFHFRFALTIYDEVHHQGALWFAQGSELTFGRRLGLTATLKRKDRCETMITFQIGPVIYDDPEEDTVEIAEVRVWDTGVSIKSDDPRILDVNGQPNIGKLRTALSEDTARNSVIVKTLKYRLRQGHKVYVLSHSVDMAVTLHDMMETRGVPTGLITGRETDAHKRLYELNNFDCVIATMGVGKENYNRKELSALAIVTPMGADSYAPTELVQGIGRIRRPHPNKLHLPPVLDLFCDSGVEPSMGMLFAVLRFCRERGWPITGDKPWKTRTPAALRGS